MEQEIGTLKIDTPEQVALEFDLAGIGSRFMAVFIDHLIQGVAIFVLALIAWAFASAISSVWATALLVLAIFLLNWGYFTLFETFRDGQTPGKKLVNIRVIKQNGRGVTVFEALVRNFLRVIDWLPLSYLVGMVSMFVDRRNRRLGDLAAGTLVVHQRENAAADVKFSITRQSNAEATSGGYDIRKLDVGDLELMETFLARRFEIESYARHVTAERLADMMRTKLGIDRASEPDDERLLASLAKLLRDTASFHR